MELPRRFRGVWIPKEIWLSPDLSPTEKMLIAEIDSLDARGGCFASNRHFSKFLNVTEVQISRIISKMKSKGIIEVEQKNVGGKTKRTIKSALTFMIRRSDSDRLNILDKSALTFQDIGHDQNDKASIIDTHLNNPNERHMSASDGFEQFWDKYPKKELKVKALEIWKRKNIGKDIAKVLEFIEKAKTSDRWNRGFIKQPTAFLNGECWNDDLTSYNDRTLAMGSSQKEIMKY